MRCFVAVEMPPEVKDYLFELVKKIKGKDIKVNFTAKKNLHLTLSFLGEIDNNKVSEAIKALRDLKVGGFSVKLSGSGVFNDRVLWVGLVPEKEIFNLANKVDESLIMFAKDRQEFKSHVTLGKVKEFKDKKKFLERFSKLEVKPIQFEIKEFRLHKSVLSREGPKHTLIEKFDMG